MQLTRKRPIRALFTLLTALCLFARANRLAAATPTTGDPREKLRALARAPKMNMTFNIAFDTKVGFFIVEDPDRTPSEIAALQAALKVEGDNPRLHLQLGRWLEHGGNTNQANKSYQRALEVLRPRAEANPLDGGLQSDLAEALLNTKGGDEAESLMRRATAKMPDDWRCWRELGWIVGGNAMRDLCCGPHGPTEVARGRDSDREAAKCFDRAVELAPENPDAYFWRVLFRWTSAQLHRRLQELAGEKPDPDVRPSDLVPPAALLDLWQVARLGRTNTLALGSAAFFELTLAYKATGEEGMPDMNRIPDGSRQIILEAMTLLEALGQSADPKLACSALEILGGLQFLSRNSKPAIANLRRATALDPTRHVAWELLSGAYINEADFTQLIEVCAQRLKTRDTPRNHLLYAKACDKADKPEQALTEAEKALAMAPEDFGAQLAVIGMRLRLAREPEQLTEVGRRMDETSKLLFKTPWTSETAPLHEAYQMNWCILMGLSDRANQARQVLAKWLARDPSNDWALEIMSALGPLRDAGKAE